MAPAYKFNHVTGVFNQIQGNYNLISAGNTENIWAIVDQTGEPKKFNLHTGALETVAPGRLSMLDVGSEGDMWGIGLKRDIYHYNASTRRFDRVEGELDRISVGNRDNIWGLKDVPPNSFEIYKWDISLKKFIRIDGVLGPVLDVGADGDVWGIRSTPYEPNGVNPHEIYRFDEFSQRFKRVEGALRTVSVGNRTNIWGINASNDIFRYNTSDHKFHQVPGKLAQLDVGADGDVWGVTFDKNNYNSKVYHYDGSTGAFKQFIPAELNFIAVGDRITVWGLNWPKIIP